MRFDRIVGVGAFLVCLGAGAAFAKGKPEDVFGGTIKMSDKPFPLSAKSVGAYIGTVRKQAKDRFWENKEKKEWIVYYTAYFKKPVNDLEVTLKTYDVSGGVGRLVESYEIYLDTRDQRVVNGRVNLKRGDDGSNYSPNSKIRMVLENRGRVLAQSTFYLQGEGKKYTGKVEFTEEETQGGASK
jgi:hypothetical protein